jgi:hypothetical protein
MVVLSFRLVTPRVPTWWLLSGMSRRPRTLLPVRRRPALVEIREPLKPARLNRRHCQRPRDAAQTLLGFRPRSILSRLAETGVGLVYSTRVLT